MDRKYLLAQSYSTQSEYFIGCYAPQKSLRFLYDRRGAALQTPPWPGSLPHASANVS